MTTPASQPDRQDEASLVQRQHVAAVVLLLLLLALPAWFTTPSTVPDGATRAAIRLRLNPNTASAAELQLLPGVGPVLAGNIVEYRRSAVERPAFRSLADLENVRRIGPKTAARLEPYLTFEPEGRHARGHP